MCDVVVQRLRGGLKGYSSSPLQGLFFPEEIELHRKCMRRSPQYGNLSNAYVDSFAVPRSTFGRMITFAGAIGQCALGISSLLSESVVLQAR